MSHKKAKLLRKLMRGCAADVIAASDNDGGDAISFSDNVSFSEVLDIFAPQLEELTPQLIEELRLKGTKLDAKELEEMRQLGCKYNRKRNSFMGGVVSF
jgi:tRNA(His) 5'-end guanylyltransferase